jgi:hypothetical protein
LNLRRRKWQEGGEDCIMRTFITCYWLIKSREMSSMGHVACMGEMQKAYKISVKKTSREDTTHKFKGMDWILLAHDRVAILNLCVSLKGG